VTGAEAHALLQTMSATWPNFTTGELGARLWLDDLVPLRHVTAVAAFRALRHEATFAPSPAEFHQSYAEVLEHERYDPPPRPELVAAPARRLSVEQVHALVADLKDQLQAKDAEMQLRTAKKLRPPPPPPPEPDVNDEEEPW
jgi:hypothetical protein